MINLFKKAYCCPKIAYIYHNEILKSVQHDSHFTLHTSHSHTLLTASCSLLTANC
ncbi:hypothetical protein BN3087_660062 [Sulfurovum sp. enrichment culture clone C5]|uniref:Uncharacterized protein n=1 Tax=Sulfurovum sp. enrichment culture clone C5 TaxID=497650 RepID=A0A0S4XQG9_9BACT|nr:hypothetical protein BN3087_660062 [Sulfurovum sp. enrichment culture clone C5]